MNDQMQRTVVLVDRAKVGDPAAQNELIERYEPRVLPIVRAHLRRPVRKLMDSQDIVQEVMVQALHNLDGFAMRDENSFLHYLGVAAVNKIRDHADALKAKKRDVRREVEMAAPAGADSAAIDLPDRNATTPSQDVARNEMQEAVNDCVAELSDSHRELISMRNYANMDWQAIGDSLGIKPDAARQRHASARVALGRLLQQRGLAPDAV
jgi:RNA polymerase sigma-70 factor, ECF subfamily